MDIQEPQNIKTSKNIKNLFLDPNNYRFVDHENYRTVLDDLLTDPKIQQRTLSFIEGKNREGIKDLLSSFKANGFLEVDMIQLKNLGNNNYLVLEGNRRVAALKILQEDQRKGFDIGKLDPKVFNSVPSVIHDINNSENDRIIMGLKHISGNKKWPAINQAKLIFDYLSPYFLTPEYTAQEKNLCESLGISMLKLRSTQRAYHLIQQYRQSDYGDQFESDMYYSFVEISKSPSIKAWIEWSDEKYKAKNQDNVLRLFSWISEREHTELIEHEENIDEEPSKLPAIITKYTEIRDLAKFINNDKALDAMENTGRISQGLLTSGAIQKENIETSINNLKNSIEEINRLKDLIAHEDLEDIRPLYENFKAILPQEAFIDTLSDNHSVCFEKGKVSHFNSITIQQYKIYRKFELNNLNKINIFSGPNNTGKTTLLEAIFLLTKQNNIGSYFDIIKFRSKLDKLNTLYLNDYIKDDIVINGCFNNTQTKINIQKIQAENIDKKDDYLASYKVVSYIADEHLETVVHTFRSNPLVRYFQKIEVLCNSLFKSPFFFNKNEVVNTHHKTLEKKAFDKVRHFINCSIDQNIKDISFSEKNDIKRFLVNSESFSESLDITSYGEGLQRIFELALSFAYCQNGVLLIDEIETAIHYSLLVDFTKFIQELSNEFNVQVFITTHSKECISAFLENGYRNEDITHFTLVKGNDGAIKKIRYNADTLLDSLEQNLEIRGW
jgi:AAA15 family ATPase/GTPase